MAYTVPVLDIYNNKASCYLVDPSNLADDAPHASPLTAANLPRVLFHSDLAYYQAIIDQTITASFPSRVKGAAGSGTATVPTTNLTAAYVDHALFGSVTTPTVPYGFAEYGGVPLVEPYMVQEIGLGGADVRRRWLEIRFGTSPIVTIREYFWFNTFAASGVTLPAISASMRAVAFQKVIATVGADLIDFNGAANTFQFGKLLLDGASAARLMRESATGMPVTAGRTIDFSSGGVRIWNPYTGTYADAGTYSGSFTPTIRRVE